MRFLALDGWRGLAALIVALYHLSFYNHIQDSVFLRSSYLFVDFFFILSGFVISHAYKGKLNNLAQVKTFMTLRIARLWPLHIFVLMLFVVLETVKLLLFQTGGWEADIPFTNEYSISSLFSNIFLLQSLNIHTILSWNFPSWSISVELYTYLIFAIIHAISNKYKYLLRLFYFLVIAMSLIIIYLSVDILDDATYENGIFRCLTGFFLGSICYQIFNRLKKLRIPAATVVEISLLLGVIAFIVLAGSNKYSLFAPIVFSIVVFFFAFEQGLISRLLKTKYIQNLGTWSYSIYMLHALVILFIGRAFSLLERVLNKSFTIEYMVDTGDKIELFHIINPYVMDMFTLIYMAFLIKIASLSYKYIELKGAKLKVFKIPAIYQYRQLK